MSIYDDAIAAAAATAAAMAADPKWRFATDPENAVVHCTTVAVEHSLAGRGGKAAPWVRVAVALVAFADNPNVKVGAVLGDLADEYGIAH